jgi:Lrp/AsnC family transcriptional regulator, leucine-responsive regulatory protein
VTDVIDRDILSCLESDGRLSFKDLSERVGLSANAVAERVRRLLQRGVICRFATEVDLKQLGLPLRALVEVKLESTTTAQQLQALAGRIPGVLRALVTTGRYDVVLEVAATDQEDLQRIIEALRVGGQVRDTYTRVIAGERRFALNLSDSSRG